MNFNNKSFTDDLRFKVKQERYSLRDAAEEMGVSVSTLSRISRGHIPDVATLGKVCGWMEESVDKYFFEIPEDTEDFSPPVYTALDTDTVIMFREHGIPEYEIAGINRYVQTIIDERDHFATGKPYDMPELKIPSYDDVPILVELAPTASDFCMCTRPHDGDGIMCSKCGKSVF